MIKSSKLIMHENCLGKVLRALAWGLALISLGGAAFGQFAKNPQEPITLDPEYRKHDA